MQPNFRVGDFVRVHTTNNYFQFQGREVEIVKIVDERHSSPIGPMGYSTNISVHVSVDGKIYDRYACWCELVSSEPTILSDDPYNEAMAAIEIMESLK